MTTHFGLQILSGVSKTIFEVALEYYASRIIKSRSGYLSSHIHEICSNDDPKLHDTYAQRANGYITIEQSMEKILASETELCKQIKEMMQSFHEEEDFIILDPASTTSQSSPEFDSTNPPPNTPELPELEICETKSATNNDVKNQSTDDDSINDDVKKSKKTKAQRRRARRAKVKANRRVAARAYAKARAEKEKQDRLAMYMNKAEDIVVFDAKQATKKIADDLIDEATEATEETVDQNRCVIC